LGEVEAPHLTVYLWLGYLSRAGSEWWCFQIAVDLLPVAER
jgi:hypothetical protein